MWCFEGSLWLQANLRVCCCQRRRSHSLLLPTLSLPFLPHPLRSLSPLFWLTLCLFSWANSTQTIVHFLIIFFQAGEVSWLMVALENHCGRVAVPNKQEHTQNVKVGGGGVYTFFGNDLLDPSTTSCRSEPWIVCCQWNVCICKKFGRMPTSYRNNALLSSIWIPSMSLHKQWEVRPTLLDS